MRILPVFGAMSARHFKHMCYLASIGHSPMAAILLTGAPPIDAQADRWAKNHREPLNELVSVARETLGSITARPDELEIIRTAARPKLVHGTGGSLMLQVLMENTPVLMLLFYSTNFDREEFEAGLRLIVEAFGEQPNDSAEDEAGTTA